MFARFIVALAAWCVFASVCNGAPAAHPIDGVAGSPPSVNLCRPDEQLLFNCLRGHQAFFLCGSTDLSRTHGNLQYRAFKDGVLQMSYPALPAPPSGRFFESFKLYSGGGDTNVRFESGGYTYVLYNSMPSWPVDMENHRRSTYDTGASSGAAASFSAGLPQP